jgi:hypothetical protein
LNREFLEVMALVAREHGVRLAVYVVPLNPLAETPYLPQEYEAFKHWLADFAAARRVPFANLEHTVPAGEWGLFAGGPDFKHFKGSGHRRTADALCAQFPTLLVAPQPAASSSP